MLVGAVITGLVGVGITVGGAAAGAHYANASHKVAGAALGAGAGILASGLISLFYAAAVGDQTIATNAGANTATRGAFGTAGVPAGLPAARDSVMERLATVGPFIARK